MKSLVERGMIPEAVEAYEIASDNADIDIKSRADMRAVQLIGDAEASAKFHLADGEYKGRSYTAAADFSVRGLTKSQIATWLEELCLQGFEGFYRNWPGNLHIHANYCGVPMKPQLDGQHEDFFRGKDGLVGHKRIDHEWWYPEAEARWICERMFRLSNPRDGSKGKVVTRADVVPAPPKVTPTFALHLNRESQPRLWMPVLDGVSWVPVRAWGSIFGFETHYRPDTKTVVFDDHVDAPIAVKLLAGVGHAPLRQLVQEAALKVQSLDVARRKVVVSR